MMTIYEWTAKRSGACMTVTGKDTRGKPEKLAEIDSIERRADGSIVAVKVGRDVAQLACGSVPSKVAA